jgi:hypothetical protein
MPSALTPGSRFWNVEAKIMANVANEQPVCGLSAMYTGYVDSTRFDDDPVQVYLSEVCAIPALTKDEEIELSQHVLATTSKRNPQAKP